MPFPYSKQFFWVLHPEIPHRFKYSILPLLLLLLVYLSINFYSQLHFNSKSCYLFCKNIYRVWIGGNVLVFGDVTTPPQYFKVRYSSPNRPELVSKETYQNKIKFLIDSVSQCH